MVGFTLSGSRKVGLSQLIRSYCSIFGGCGHQLLDLRGFYTPSGTSGSSLDCDWRPLGYPKAFSFSLPFSVTRRWCLSPFPGPLAPRLFELVSLVSREILPPQDLGEMDFSGQDLPVCQLKPSFPSLFLFSPFGKNSFSQTLCSMDESVFPFRSPRRSPGL